MIQLYLKNKNNFDVSSEGVSPGGNNSQTLVPRRSLFFRWLHQTEKHTNYFVPTVPHLTSNLFSSSTNTTTYQGLNFIAAIAVEGEQNAVDLLR
jgi:hypothetical protein